MATRKFVSNFPDYHGFVTVKGRKFNFKRNLIETDNQEVIDAVVSAMEAGAEIQEVTGSSVQTEPVAPVVLTGNRMNAEQGKVLNPPPSGDANNQQSPDEVQQPKVEKTLSPADLLAQMRAGRNTGIASSASTAAAATESTSK